MFHLLHLGDEIGHLDQLILCVSAGDDDMDVFRLLILQKRHHLGNVEIIVAQHDVQLVAEHHPVVTAGDHLLGRIPGFLCRSNVTLAVLRFPGEALAHALDGDEIGKALQRLRFARVETALDELHHTNPVAMAEGAEHHAEACGGFALALAGVDDGQALLDGLGGHDLVARRLLLAHLLGMAGVQVFFGLNLGVGLGHGGQALMAWDVSWLERPAWTELRRGVQSPRRMASSKRWRMSS